MVCRVLLSVLVTTFLAGTLPAATVGFVEDFSTNHSNWLNSPGTGPNQLVTFKASGGPDGGSYAEATYNFVNNTGDEGDNGGLFLRGQTVAPSILASDGKLFGDWIEDGVHTLSMSVRHNAPFPLTYYLRVATPMGFPGAVVIRPQPVFPNTWTELDFSIDYNNPLLILETEEPDYDFFEDVFGNIGRIQLGVSTPAALAGVDYTVTFGIDKIYLVPEPATWSTLGAAGLVSLLLLRRTRVRPVVKS